MVQANPKSTDDSFVSSGIEDDGSSQMAVSQGPPSSNDTFSFGTDSDE